MQCECQYQSLPNRNWSRQQSPFFPPFQVTTALLFRLQKAAEAQSQNSSRFGSKVQSRRAGQSHHQRLSTEKVIYENEHGRACYRLKPGSGRPAARERGNLQPGVGEENRGHRVSGKTEQWVTPATWLKAKPYSTISLKNQRRFLAQKLAGIPLEFVFEKYPQIEITKQDGSVSVYMESWVQGRI